MLHGARILAAERYRLKTLTVRADAIIAVVQGAKALHAADRVLAVGPGEGVLMARGTQWDIVNDPRGRTRYEAVVLAFDDALLEAAASRPAIGPVRAVTSATVLAVDEPLRVALLRTLPSADADAAPAGDPTRRVLDVLELLAARGHRFVPHGALDWSERVRRLVAQRPHADWRVDTLADAFHLSESSLRRRLDGCGVTLAALVREVRLEIALGLLQTTALPIGEVAQRCGWESHSRFSAAFLERWGAPPSVVRAHGPSAHADAGGVDDEMKETG